MRKIQVGIAYEGSADIDALKIILKRLLNEHELDFDTDAVHPQTPGSGIIGFVAVYAKRFADSGVRLAVYCTDQDKDKKSRREVIIGKLKASAPAMFDTSVVGVSVPHFEAWLIADEDTVKTVLNLEGSAPLPFASLQPKDRLTALYQNKYEGSESVADIRCMLASKMNLAQIERNKNDFNAFVSDIRRAANTIKGSGA